MIVFMSKGNFFKAMALIRSNGQAEADCCIFMMTFVISLYVAISRLNSLIGRLSSLSHDGVVKSGRDDFERLLF